jgi:hypothetical protein
MCAVHTASPSLQIKNSPPGLVDIGRRENLALVVLAQEQSHHPMVTIIVVGIAHIDLNLLP